MWCVFMLAHLWVGWGREEGGPGWIGVVAVAISGPDGGDRSPEEDMEADVPASHCRVYKH